MRPRIIVLEDEENTRRLLSLVLEQHGYEVISAAEPSRCQLFADLNGPCPHPFPCCDVLLTDNRMPHMTGLELIARQEQRGCWGKVQNKAVISGFWKLHDLETAARLGCQTFTKPYRIKDILAWLSERLETIPPDRQLADLTDL